VRPLQGGRTTIITASMHSVAAGGMNCRCHFADAFVNVKRAEQRVVPSRVFRVQPRRPVAAAHPISGALRPCGG